MRHRQCKHILAVLAAIEGRNSIVRIIPRRTTRSDRTSPQNIRKVVTDGDEYNPRYFADSSGGFDGTAQGLGYKSIEALKKHSGILGTEASSSTERIWQVNS
jgi:hypothetical protein